MYLGYDITAIRILPSDKETFPTEASFKAFIEKTMLERGGYYYFPRTIMRCPNDALILFQYGGMIRAIGILIGAEKRDVVDERGVSYSGYYKFDTNTVRYLVKPIDKNVLKSIYPLFISFNQSKQKIPIEYLDALIELIEDRVEMRAEQIVNNIEKEIEQSSLQGNSREAFVKVRVNQGVFREKLLQRYDKCCLCGVKSSTLLTASHIKPWRVSSSTEKLDVNNGLLMCPNHDKLFDQGWITFDDEGKICISNQLDEIDRLFMNVHDKMKINVTEENKKYLEYHRGHIFKDSQIFKVKS